MSNKVTNAVLPTALLMSTSPITCSRKKSNRWWQYDFDFSIIRYPLDHDMKQRMPIKMASNVLVSLSLKKWFVSNPPWLVVLRHNLVYLNKSALQVFARNE